MKKLKLQCCMMAAFWLIVLTSFAQAQTYTDLYDLTQATGSAPGSPNLLAQGQDGSLYSTMPSSFPGDGTTIVAPPTGGIVTVTHYFQGTDGFAPQSGLTLGMDGNFYGTTSLPSTGIDGEVFQVTPAGTVTVLYGFSNTTDGGYPWAPPTQASDGNLYGVTRGTTPVAYKIVMPAATFSVLANLPAASVAPLIVGTDGNFYGTTQTGGKFNAGTVFQLTKKGVLKIIYNFGTAASDGSSPSGPVMQAADGRLYGTTYWGGATGNGIVYQVTTAGAYKILHSFNGTDGSHSSAGLVQGSDNFLYGTTVAGGALGNGAFFKINTTGTTYAVLHDFDGKTSGGSPGATPVLHTNGTIYGWGTVGPKEGVLYSMNVGLKPFASLVVLTSGKVGATVGILGQGFSSATGVQFGSGTGSFTVVSDTYMTASPKAGATTGKVTILEPSGNLVTPQKFKVIPTIKSFSPTSGTVGTSVVITGMSLSQTTAVKFGTVAATFTVNSNTQVTATVPAGAVTGKISVTTQGGTATTATSFTVN
ncbi:MAG: IPT/TIG domain-containing protein [Acidobacteriia bacterium]|nr:IPT/TIG domain-containing protein [Terriglobia bacterium]